MCRRAWPRSGFEMLGCPQRNRTVSGKGSLWHHDSWRMSCWCAVLLATGEGSETQNAREHVGLRAQFVRMVFTLPASHDLGNREMDNFDYAAVCRMILLSCTNCSRKHFPHHLSYHGSLCYGFG
jgi:hypothetical protein